MNPEAKRLVEALRLEPLAGEGGYFRQTWCGESGSAILFLITPGDFSALHRIAQDEVWHFYGGDAVEHVRLDARMGEPIVTRLGSDVLREETPQLVVPRGMWQGARLGDAKSGRGFALLGCTVTPPYDPAGFELGDRAALVAEFPDAREWITALTR